jgi:hypothetical protein
MSSDCAHNPAHSVIDVLDRALAETANTDRILVVMQGTDGQQIWQFSNARSTAEHQGMLTLAGRRAYLSKTEGRKRNATHKYS